MRSVRPDGCRRSPAFHDGEPLRGVLGWTMRRMTVRYVPAAGALVRSFMLGFSERISTLDGTVATCVRRRGSVC